MSAQKNSDGITGLAIKNNVTVYVVITLLFFAGISSYTNLPKQQDPGFIIRAAVLTTVYPGANADQVEELVTDRVEEIVQEIPEVDYIESDSKPGVSVITVHFQDKYKIMQPIFDKLRRKMNDLKGDGSLPYGTLGPMVNDEYGDVFGIIYALRGDGFSMAELKDYADQIRSDLLQIEAVGKVNIHGTQEEEIYVDFDMSELNKLKIRPEMLAGFISQSNILRSSGDIQVGRERLVLESTGNFNSLDELKKTIVKLPGQGGAVYLGDITKISRGYKDPVESLTNYNGEQALHLAISLKEGGDILTLNETLDQKVPEIEVSYPYGISLKKVFSQPKLVEDSVSSFMSNLLQAILIVAGVMFAFLGFRTGIIVSSLIPTTIVTTFVLMSIFGITVNQISLAALIIALGLLVDNAIVMSEAITIRRENGESAIRAAIESGKEMSNPLLISSLTTAAAFLAIYLAESAIGEYTADIFKVVTIALLSSWVLSMTFIPLLSISILKVGSGEPGSQDPYQGKMYAVYRKIIFFALRKKSIAIASVVGLLFVSVWALRFVPQVFIPERRDPILNANFTMPRGTDISSTRRIIEDVEGFMLKKFSVKEGTEGGIDDLVSFIGVGAPRYVLAINPDPPDTHIGAMIVRLGSFETVQSVIEATKKYASENYPDLELKMRKMENGVPINYPIVIRVSGRDMDELYAVVDSIKDKLRSYPGATDVTDDWGMKTKKLLIDIDEDRALKAGVTNQDISSSLESGLSGLRAARFREKNNLIPITIRSNAADREDLDSLEGTLVFSSNTGVSVPLKQVADINLVWERPYIKRRSRMRTIEVRSQLREGVTAAQIMTSMVPWLKENSQSWPRGYTYAIGGESEESEKAGKSIADKLPISGVFIVLLLMLQFNSVRKTSIILLTIPLGIIGITSGLIIANSIFGFFTILGLISLAGIIINNAIVLIDRINIEIEENGRAPAEAVIEACQQRLRPILLTTCTTVGGMLPLWISRDPMFETMAVSIIFGLLFATILTLVFVPVLYSILFGVKYSSEQLSA